MESTMFCWDSTTVRSAVWESILSVSIGEVGSWYCSSVSSSVRKASLSRMPFSLITLLEELVVL